jgi:hypothetical protein
MNACIIANGELDFHSVFDSNPADCVSCDCVSNLTGNVSG